MCLQIVYIFDINVYKEDLAENNPQWLIYHKTKLNPTKPNLKNMICEFYTIQIYQFCNYTKMKSMKACIKHVQEQKIDKFLQMKSLVIENRFYINNMTMVGYR